MLLQRENLSLHLKLPFIRMVSTENHSILYYKKRIIIHVGHAGFPYPENIALASLLESVVRENGGVPATIGILGGVARVGMSATEIVELASTAEKKSALKVSRRDLGYICGMVSVISLTPHIRHHW